MLHSLQVFPGASVGVREGQRRAEFLGGSAPVSLLLEYLAQEMGVLKGRAFLNRSSKVPAEQANGHRRIATGAQKEASPVHERFRAVDRTGLHGAQRLLHFVEAVGAE